MFDLLLCRVEQKLVGDQTDGIVYSVEDAQNIVHKIRDNYKNLTIAEVSSSFYALYEHTNVVICDSFTHFYRLLQYTVFNELYFATGGEAAVVERIGAT